jgi:hypothetical protein
MENTRTAQKAAAVTKGALNTTVRESHIGLVYILVALNVLDVMTTHIGLQMGAVEANPVVAGLMGGFGEGATYLVKVSVVLAAALLLARIGRPQALKWLNLGMAGIVVSNLFILTNSLIG